MMRVPAVGETWTVVSRDGLAHRVNVFFSDDAGPKSCRTYCNVFYAPKEKVGRYAGAPWLREPRQEGVPNCLECLSRDPRDIV